jgi:precorrin-6A/cobalt-precorrin-6A reductase
VTVPTRVLLLGGSTEATRLARALASWTGFEVVTSLAGRTASPVLPEGRVRVGGFGGTAGLVTYLAAEAVGAVLDATHPFAAVMPWHAHEACERAGIPRLRVLRPEWKAQPGDRWCTVANLAAAAAAVGSGRARRVFVTTGRSGLEVFAAANDRQRHWLVRSVDPPGRLSLHPATILLGRGPFRLQEELDLMRRHGIDLLVTKNSGGDATAAKLAAARRLGIPVVIVARPPAPPGASAPDVPTALAWLSTTLSAQTGGGG